MPRKASPRPALPDWQAFLNNQAAGGVVLMLAAAAAMLIANSPAAPGYFALLHQPIGPLSILHWINDGLMAIFFLLVGLEIKREFTGGQLASWADRALPFAAAAGGMLVPALVYLAVAGDTPGLWRGWAVPTATDIAFAIGVMALLGSRVPPALKLLLTTIAIVDDMGAVIIIAIAYTPAISGPALLASGLIWAGMLGLGRLGVRRLTPYLALAVLLWIALHASGIHATIAGVLAALTIPNTTVSQDGAGAAGRTPLARLEHGLHPWVAFAIVPLFGFANAGVSLAGVNAAMLFAPLPLGIALGLFAGKQIGVFGSIRLVVALKLVRRPADASWAQIYGLALLCGIGFTMSLFIGGLAFRDPSLGDAVKIGVLGGSILSAIAAIIVLRSAASPPISSPSISSGRREAP